MSADKGRVREDLPFSFAMVCLGVPVSLPVRNLLLKNITVR